MWPHPTLNAKAAFPSSHRKSQHLGSHTQTGLPVLPEAEVADRRLYRYRPPDPTETQPRQATHSWALRASRKATSTGRWGLGLWRFQNISTCSVRDPQDPHTPRQGRETFGWGAGWHCKLHQMLIRAVCVGRGRALNTIRGAGPSTNISNGTVFAFNGLKFFKLRTQLSHYVGQFAGKWKAPNGSPRMGHTT